MEPKLGRLEANLERILERLAEAAPAGARLVVFPECALSGYGFSSREEGLAHAVSIDSAPVRRVVAACREHRCFCVFGLLERDGPRLFNACVLAGPEGVVGTYRKVHLPFLGIDMFADPGDRPFAVHDAGGLKVGMHICYDGAFPETARVLTLLGADLLVLPTNWPTHSECAAEHMIPTRAMENTVYVMAVNRVGEESGFRFIGASSIVDPSGRVLARAGPDSEEILFADIDPALARRKHLVRVPGPARDRPDRRPPAAVLRDPGRAERAGLIATGSALANAGRSRVTWSSLAHKRPLVRMIRAVAAAGDADRPRVTGCRPLEDASWIDRTRRSRLRWNPLRHRRRYRGARRRRSVRRRHRPEAAVAASALSFQPGAVAGLQAPSRWRSSRARARCASVKVGPQGQCRLVLPARQVELTGCRQ